jgi:hypothetical protein
LLDAYPREIVVKAQRETVYIVLDISLQLIRVEGFLITLPGI